MDLRAYRYLRDPAGHFGGSCQPDLDAVTLQTIWLTYREVKAPVDVARFLAGALNYLNCWVRVKDSAIDEEAEHDASDR